MSVKFIALILLISSLALATITTETSRVTYTGNGAVDTYAYTFKVFSDNDLEVIVRDTDDADTTLTKTTHYTVTGAGVSGGGNVVLVNGAFDWLDGDGDLLTDYKLTIRRKLLQKQETSISNQGAYYPRIHENVFDRLTMFSLQQQDELDRTMKTPWGDTVVDLTLPLVSERASTFLAFNASGVPIAAAGVSSVPISTFWETVLDDTTAGASHVTLGVGAIPASNGMAAYTGSNAFTARTISAGTGITVTNGDGQAGNPTITLAIPDGAVTGAAGGGKLAYSAVNGQTSDAAPALNDEVLTGDTSASGLKKTTLAEIVQLSRIKNYAQNGEFRFWERQEPGTLTSRQDDAYSADRWYLLNSGGAVNIQGARVDEVISSSPTPYVAQFRNADASARQFGPAQILEYERSVALRGKQVTLSFWARTDTTEVPNLRAGIVEWTGTADSVTSDIVSSWAATPTLIANAAFVNTPGDLALTGTMQQFTVTVTLGSTFNNLILFVWTAAAEAQNDDFYITQVQLVEHSEALPWNLIRLSLVDDEKECQRFYEKSYLTGVAPGTSTTDGVFVFLAPRTFTSNHASNEYKTRKRTVPTVVLYSSDGTINTVRDTSAGANVAASGTLIGTGRHAAQFAANDGSSTLWHWTADAEL